MIGIKITGGSGNVINGSDDGGIELNNSIAVINDVKYDFTGLKGEVDSTTGKAVSVIRLADGVDVTVDYNNGDPFKTLRDLFEQSFSEAKSYYDADTKQYKGKFKLIWDSFIKHTSVHKSNLNSKKQSIGIEIIDCENTFINGNKFNEN